MEAKLEPQGVESRLEVRIGTSVHRIYQMPLPTSSLLRFPSEHKSFNPLILPGQKNIWTAEQKPFKE
jgi:hypothetical protein